MSSSGSNVATAASVGALVTTGAFAMHFSSEIAALRKEIQALQRAVDDSNLRSRAAESAAERSAKSFRSLSQSAAIQSLTAPIPLGAGQLAKPAPVKQQTETPVE